MSISNSNFISLTLHFVNDEFELQSLVLGVKHFSSTHFKILISQINKDNFNELYDLTDLSS